MRIFTSHSKSLTSLASLASLTSNKNFLKIFTSHWDPQQVMQLTYTALPLWDMSVDVCLGRPTPMYCNMSPYPLSQSQPLTLSFTSSNFHTPTKSKYIASVPPLLLLFHVQEPNLSPELYFCPRSFTSSLSLKAALRRFCQLIIYWLLPSCNFDKIPTKRELTIDIWSFCDTFLVLILTIVGYNIKVGEQWSCVPTACSTFAKFSEEHVAVCR